MRKIIVFLAISIIAAVGLNAQERTLLKVKVQVANVRAEPDMNSAVVKQVNLGTQLESRQKIGDWFEIMVTDDKGMAISGYINSSVVDVVSPGGAKPEPQVSPTPVAAKPAAVAQPQETTLLKVKVQVASIRTDPDMNSAVVKQVNLGTQLESRQKIGDWFEVMVTDDRGRAISGYINSSVVDVVSPGGAKPAPQVSPTPVAAKPAPQESPAPVARIQRRWPSIMILGRYGSFAPSDGIFKTVYGSGSVYGGEFRLHIAGGFYVSLDGGYFNKKGLLTLTQEETTMTIYPIDAMLIFHALSGTILPYVGAGGAVCKYGEENVIGTVSGWGYGFAICGGVTAHLSSLGIDARVKYTSVKVKPLEDEAGLGGLTLSIAVGVIF